MSIGELDEDVSVFYITLACKVVSRRVSTLNDIIKRSADVDDNYVEKIFMAGCAASDISLLQYVMKPLS